MKNRPEKINSRDIQAIERRKQLLGAAEDLFYEFGYHATTVRMINRKIGMADGLIYHYFPDGKKELLETIIREGGARFVSRMESIQDGSDIDLPLKEALFKFCTHAYECHIEEIKWVSIIIKERNILKEKQAAILNEIYQGRIEVVKNFMENRWQRGEIGKVDLDIFVWQVTSVIYLALLDRISGINFADSDYKAFFKKMIDFMVDTWNR